MQNAKSSDPCVEVTFMVEKILDRAEALLVR